MTKTSLDLNKLIAARADELQKVTPGQVIEFRAGNIATVEADGERIAQVFSNFVSNAIKYSPPDGRIVIETRMEKKQVMLTVTDNGPGIQPAHRERVFERFYRGSDERTNTYPGLGLGLYIAAEIIRQHGGGIGVNSRPGEGAVFYFTLPQ